MGPCEGSLSNRNNTSNRERTHRSGLMHNITEGKNKVSFNRPVCEVSHYLHEVQLATLPTLALRVSGLSSTDGSVELESREITQRSALSSP